MSTQGLLVVHSPLGKKEIDSTGAPIGAVRMDVEQAYTGTGELLQEYINDSSQGAWDKIRTKIDYIYHNLDPALSILTRDAALELEVKQRLDKGQKLFFKPNLVNPQNIDPQTHGPDFGYTACTEWPFMAALMRWFHDKIGVSYHQMAVGEAATLVTSIASAYSMVRPDGKTVTPEAVIEGRSGDFYGGWGFCFARKYLAESLGAGASDDPMKGYEESVAGTYIPPGHATDKLMVYDLNRIFDDPSKGRACDVPGGVNYKSITLHKAIVGGDQRDKADVQAYPGCILVNVPKFKVHAITLFTNAIKNLGIGLYPMQYASAGGHKWDYSVPQDTTITGIKGGIPHQVWVPEMDHTTGLPKRDATGKYVVEETGGITATMIDVIKAASHQGTFMIHVVDGIEAINVDHQGIALGQKTPEGIVFAGLDPVATDTLSARYMFTNVPLEEALEVERNGGPKGGFLQKVPIPTVEGSNIVSKPGYDCPLSRDVCFQNAERRGMGSMQYYVQGHDLVTDAPLVSIGGHLGTVQNGAFVDLITTTLFFDAFKVPWDLQQTSLAYMKAVDELEGTSIHKGFLECFDEDGDGIVTYEEFGKKGIWGVFLHLAGDMLSELGSEQFGYLKGRFNGYSRMYKNSEVTLNIHGHDALNEIFIASACTAALQMSQLEIEMPDPFFPGLTFGKGKWPSFQLARYFQTGVMLYGEGFPNTIGFPSQYTSALFYADLTQNGGQYAGKLRNQPDPEAPSRYLSDVRAGRQKPFDFTFYVPAGFDNLSGEAVPNVEVTDDPAKVYTASFAGGKEVWPEEELRR